MKTDLFGSKTKCFGPKLGFGQKRDFLVKNLTLCPKTWIFLSKNFLVQKLTLPLRSKNVAFWSEKIRYRFGSKTKCFGPKAKLFGQIGQNSKNS